MAESWSPQPGFQEDFVDTREFVDEVFGGGNRGGGKFCGDSNLVITPFGTKEMGDICVGDMVSDPTTGGITRVVAVHKQGPQPLWCITFDDGATTMAGLPHLWAYKLPNRARPGSKISLQREWCRENMGAEYPNSRWDRLRVATTQQLILHLKNGLNPRIPLTNPIVYTVNSKLSEDPYLLGLLLGDGHLGSVSITNVDHEIIEYLKTRGFYKTPSSTITLTCRGEIKKKIKQWIVNHGLKGKRSWEKFIPSHVFTAPVEWRLGFLQGLMDSDGYADKRGRCYFCSTSIQLAQGVRELVWGLGGKAWIREKHPTFTYKGEKKQGRIAYDCHLQIPHTSRLFRLARKKERCTDSWNGGHEIMRKIVDITYSHNESSTCIQVDSGRSLYMQDDFVVTHNTEVMLADYAAGIEEWGSAWKGIIFRRTMSQFQQMIDRSKEIYWEMFGKDNARFYESKDNLHWRFSNGATLRFFHMKEDSDADKHQGLQYSWMGWDELPLFPSPVPYMKMLATLRTGTEGVPMRVRSTGNPGGPGLGWVKDRFRIPDDPQHKGGELIEDDFGWTRMFLRSSTEENVIMLRSTPNYHANLVQATEGNEELAKAWIAGDFNVFFGKYFKQFSDGVHRVDPLEILGPTLRVLPNWRIYGSLDYGESAPTSFGLWAVDEEFNSYRISEYYEGGLWEDEYGGKIRSLIANCPYTGGRKPERIFADPSIFHTRTTTKQGAQGRMVSDSIKSITGVHVVPSNNDRLSGWRFLTNLLAWKIDADGEWEKRPSLFYFPECTAFERCMTNAVHAGDEANPKEDLDTTCEDHACDDTRYFVMGGLRGRPEPHITKPEDSYLKASQVFSRLKKPRSARGGPRAKKESFMVPPTSSHVNLDYLINQHDMEMK